MMDDNPLDALDQVRLEARLLAIENILAGLFAEVNRRNGITLEQVSATALEMRQELREQLAGQREESPTSSLVVREVEQAIAALLEKIADYMRMASAGHKQQLGWKSPAPSKRRRV